MNAKELVSQYYLNAREAVRCGNAAAARGNLAAMLTIAVKEYGKAVELTGLCLKKFFPSLSEEERKEFIFAFFPFMYGLYPYVHPTEKQLDAMMDAGIERLDMDQVETARKFIKDILYGIVKEEQR